MPDSETPRPTTPGPAAGRSAGEGAPFTDGASLLDVLDRVLERGIVVEASATAALPSLDIGGGEATLTVASSETAAPGSAGWEALADLVATSDGERKAAPADAQTDELWRSGEHAALKRQFERLNA